MSKHPGVSFVTSSERPAILHPSHPADFPFDSVGGPSALKAFSNASILHDITCTSAV